jgi:excinuclease ABC subunit C
VLNRIYQLRDCSSKTPCGFTEQLQLFEVELRPGCIRHEIKTCLAPCIRGCSRKAYENQVKSARDFLAGQDDLPAERLESQMFEAAERKLYEQATVLREDLRVVQWLSRRVADLALAKNKYTFVYRVAGIDSKDVWYLIRRGQLEGALPAPRTIHDKNRTQRLIQRWYEDDRRLGTRFTARPETLALIASWFRNNKKELNHTFLDISL